MFGGKKDRALEQELQAMQEKQTRQEKILSGVAGKKDLLEEQFARATASRAQMDTELSEVVDHVKYVKELAGADANKTERFQREIAETADEARASNEVCRTFLTKVEEQKERIQEVVENNKHFTMPAKYLSEFSGSFRETEEEMLANLAKMKGYAKNMSVLSLNAAIEAGRMGDSGKKFVSAAEEVREFSRNYAVTAREVEDQLRNLEERNEELEEQMKHLTALLRENNVSMSHLLKESMTCVDDYKMAKKDISGQRLEDLKKSVSEFAEHQQEIGNRQDGILIQMEEIGKEFIEQRECMDELENICKEVITSVIM